MHTNQNGMFGNLIARAVKIHFDGHSRKNQPVMKDGATAGLTESVSPKRPQLSSRLWLRSGASKASILMGAGLVTLGLLGFMTALIAEEFEPQDRIELAAFEINAKPEETPLLINRAPPQLLERIEVPPPPPSVDIPVTDRPIEPVARAENPDNVFDPKPYIVPTVFVITPADADPTPLVRVPPIMPPRANRSGHCRVSFDIGPDGKPYNVRALACSQSLFERAAIRSVGKWVYRPKIENGLPVTRTGLETVIRFRLTDEYGGLIPE